MTRFSAHDAGAEIAILEEPLENLIDYGQIPIRFTVRTVFDVMGDEPETAQLVERPLADHWVKDYDEGEEPRRWRIQWNISNWGLLCAYAGNRRVGGCVIAYKTAGVNMLERRDDLAVLWDFRVHPQIRGQGIGGSLFAAAVHWARSKGCRELKVETQNINVPACRFYARQGCRLKAINRGVYADFPEEIQLIWCLAL